MQNPSPLDGESNRASLPAQNEQETQRYPDQAQNYVEPAYQEYAQWRPAAQQFPAHVLPSEPGLPAFVAPQGTQPDPLPQTSQPGPGYGPQTLQPGYIEQPGYVPQTPQPGYTGQLGYVPQTPQPEYTGQPSYVPMAAQPWYNGPVQPGYIPQAALPPVYSRPGRLSGLAIVGIVAAIVVVLGIVIGAISLANLGNNHPAGLASATPQVTGAPPTTQIGHPTAAFQAASCPFPPGSGLTEGQQITCGYVTVPENRSVKNGPQVKLAVAIFKAPQYLNSIDPAPVLRLDGGPGGPSLDSLARYISRGNSSTFIFNHDVVMFDQRGTGYSTPSLKCPELIALQSASASGGPHAYEQAARACHDRLVAQGVDLGGFNSIQNAADVADLIHALGYRQMTVYGVSYGTRLALTTMRLYPSVVRASVLDSVYPTNHNRNDLPSGAQRVFNVFFQGCAKDPNCNSKYPNLQNVFYGLVDQLNAQPITFNTTDPTTGQQYTIRFAGDDMVGWLFSTFYATSLIPQLPQTIYQVKAHNYTQLATIYGDVTFDSTFSDGMFYSAECSEDWPFLTQQDITASEQNITPQIAKVFGQEDEEQEYAICQFWNVPKVPAEQKQPVTSSLPTLVLSGEYDPITPPSNGQETAKTLSHSYFFLFPGQGHGQEYSSSCSDLIISAFEDNPNQQPDGSCINQMTEPAFT